MAADYFRLFSTLQFALFRHPFVVHTYDQVDTISLVYHLQIDLFPWMKWSDWILIFLKCLRQLLFYTNTALSTSTTRNLAT